MVNCYSDVLTGSSNDSRKSDYCFFSLYFCRFNKLLEGKCILKTRKLSLNKFALDKYNIAVPFHVELFGCGSMIERIEIG